MKRIFQSPRWITVILVLLALALYGWLASGQGEVRSIAFDQNDHIFAAAGQHGGVIVLNISITEVYEKTLTPTPTETPTPAPTSLAGAMTEEGKAQLTASAAQGSPQPEATASPTRTSTPAPSLVPTYDILKPLTQKIRFDTPGNALAVVPYQLDGSERSLILVADAGYGLQVYDEDVDKDDPQPLLTIPLPDVRDVVVWKNVIYVAAGAHGVFIIELTEDLATVAVPTGTVTPEPNSKPPLIYTIEGLPPHGEANGLAFYVTPYTSGTVMDTGNHPGIEYELSVIEQYMMYPYLFVADGPAGITVFNLNDVNSNASTPMPFDGFQGDVYAIWTSYVPQLDQYSSFAYVAAGAQGLVFCDISKTDHIKILHSYPLEGAEALDVAVLEGYAYVAAGRQGLYIFDVKDSEDTRLVAQFTDIHDQIYAVDVYKKHVFLAAGQDGVYVLDVSDLQNPKKTGDAYVMDWGENSLGVAWREWRDTSEVSERTKELLMRSLLDLGLVAAGFFVCLMVFAGFVLPADSPMQRLRVLGRMINVFFGGHPAGWFIDDGEACPSARERQHGLGVAVLDADSAAVFTNHKQRWQVTGPGMHFLYDDDRLLDTVALRRQAMVVGPFLGEDPFGWRSQPESRAEYRARQYRRQATSAQTSDGIEVVATLRVIFSLDGQAVEDGTQYGYDEGHISRSIASENLPASERRRPGRVPWRVQETLSAMLRRLWTENLRRYSIDDLFAPLAFAPNETGLERSLRTLYEHLTQGETRELDEHGAETGRQFPSREFRTLNGRGIHVHGIFLEAIHYTQPDEQQLARRWSDNWPAATLQEKQRLDTMGEQATLLAYAQVLTADLAGRIRDLLNPPSLEESLQILLEGSRDVAPAGSDEAQEVDRIMDDGEGWTT